MPRINDRSTRERRKSEAAARAAERATRAPWEQDLLLDTRPGECKRERKRIGAAICTDAGCDGHGNPVTEIFEG